VERLVIQFIKNIDFERISEEEKELISQQELAHFGSEGRVITNQVANFLDTTYAAEMPFRDRSDSLATNRTGGRQQGSSSRKPLIELIRTLKDGENFKVDRARNLI
jgi:hypothetical protein